MKVEIKEKHWVSMWPRAFGSIEEKKVKNKKEKKRDRIIIIIFFFAKRKSQCAALSACKDDSLNL